MKRAKIIMLCLSAGVAVLLAACAPQANPEPAAAPDAGEEELTTAWWTPDSDCTMCHENSVATLASLPCEAAKATEPTDACATCHDDTANIEAAHENVAMSDTAGDASYLKTSKIKEDTCLACHNRDDLVAATAEVDDLTDYKRLTVNPHETSTVHNVNEAHDGITCGSCHKMHSTDGTPTGKVAYDYCIDCHHTGQFECNTCH